MRPEINSNDFGRFWNYVADSNSVVGGNCFQITIRFVVCSKFIHHTQCDFYMYMCCGLFSHVLIRCIHTVERKERDRKRDKCHQFVVHRQRSGKQTEQSKKHACSNESVHRDSWSGTALSGSANDQMESGTCCSRPVLKHSLGEIKWFAPGESPVQVLTPSLSHCFSAFFCFCPCSPFSPSSPCSSLLPLGLTPPCVEPNTPPCVDSKRPRVYGQNAHMYKTCGRVSDTHGDALNRHTEACWDLHTFFSTFFFFQRAVPHTPHHMHTHNTKTTQHNTNSTQHHTETERQR